MVDVANPEEVALSFAAKIALGSMVPTLTSKSPLSQNDAIYSFAGTIQPLAEKLPAADRKKLVTAINANPKAAADAMLFMVTDGKGAFDPQKAANASANFPTFANALLTKIAPAEAAPAVAATTDVNLSEPAKLALQGVMKKIQTGNPTVAEADIHQVSVNFISGLKALPKDQSDQLITLINKNPEAAANSIYTTVTNAQGVFTPTPVKGMADNFSQFANKMTSDIQISPPVLVSSDMSPEIEKAMHTQLATAFDKGLANVGRASSPLTKEEGAWFDQKTKDPAFVSQVMQATLAGFQIDKAAGTYNKDAFQKYIENPERVFYESAKRVEHNAGVPNPTQPFTAVANDPDKSPALVAFEKKLAVANPDMKKRYDEFAKGHAEFRGNMAQILGDVPEMSDAAIQNPALLKVAMEDSSLAAKKVRESKDMIRSNADILKTASAGDIRSALGMPTPPGEPISADMASSGMMMKFVQMIGQFLTKMFPGLAPYVEEFTGMTDKMMQAKSALTGIDAPGTQNTGDPKIVADAKATQDAKPADTKPADAKPEVVAADPVAEQKKRMALGYG